MYKHRFKVGDKVRLVRHGSVGWEDGNIYTQIQLEMGKVYTVRKVHGNTHQRATISLENPRNSYHPDHFEPYKLSNEERIAKRREQVHG